MGNSTGATIGDGSEGNGAGAGAPAVRVAFVSQFVYPHDEEVRIRRLAASLSSHGWRCAVFSRGQSGIPDEDACGPVRVRRWRAARLGPIGGILAAPLPWNPLWIGWLSRQFRDFGADVVIVRNLRLALLGVVAARACGLPVVLDWSENFPALVKAIGRQKLAHVLNHPFIVRHLEAVCLRMADAVWVVERDNGERVRAIRGSARRRADGDDVRVISNYPLLCDIAQFDVPAVQPREPGELRAVFIGKIDNLRGLDMVVRALSRRAARSVRLTVIGDGFDLPRIRALAAEEGVSDRISFVGWMPNTEVHAYLMRFDVGLVPHAVNELTQTTIPNKLFDYMAAGVCVLSSPMRPVAEIVEQEKCGEVVAFDPDAWARAFAELAAAPDRRRQMGSRGRAVVLARYNWERAATEAIETVSALLGRHRRNHEG